MPVKRRWDKSSWKNPWTWSSALSGESPFFRQNTYRGFQYCRASDSQASLDSSALPQVALSTQVHRVSLNVSLPSLMGNERVTVVRVVPRAGWAFPAARAPGLL